jgi:NAD(P)-dependent dehydrogenase (short-subunit alcohol dehydrogenase family)
MINYNLDNKVALITEANHGIGAATAKALAAEGTKVFITYYRTSPEDYGIDYEDAKAAKEPGMPLYHFLYTKKGMGKNYKPEHWTFAVFCKTNSLWFKQSSD